MSAIQLGELESLPPEVLALLNSEDGPAFEQALDRIVREREQHLFRTLGRLARDLHGAMRRLGGELTFDGGQQSMADARRHLVEVLDMSALAAHRCLDFADRIRPETAALSANATAVLDFTDGLTDPAAVLARQALSFTEKCSEGLDDMVLAQSWHDLSGQRIKKVVQFIESVETSVLELVRLTGSLAAGDKPATVTQVASQEDADRLLSEFGF